MHAEETIKEDDSYAGNTDYDKYHVDGQKSQIARAPINWSSYPEAKDFKTRITEAYNTSEVSFASHYILSAFGCGASCIMGFMVDVRDGKIYDLPLGEENSCSFAEDRMLCNITSKLFISAVCKENYEAKKMFYKAYLWNEEKKEFAPTKEQDFLKEN